MNSISARARRGTVVVAGGVAALALLAGCTAPSGDLVATFPATSTVGQTLPATIQATNSDTSSESIAQIWVLPSCGGDVQLSGTDFPSELGCALPDPNVVFAFDPGDLENGMIAP